MKACHDVISHVPRWYPVAPQRSEWQYDAREKILFAVSSDGVLPQKTNVVRRRTTTGAYSPAPAQSASAQFCEGDYCIENAQCLSIGMLHSDAINMSQPIAMHVGRGAGRKPFSCGDGRAILAHDISTDRQLSAAAYDWASEYNSITRHMSACPCDAGHGHLYTATDCVARSTSSSYVFH